jgi:hypothetical protein
VAQFKFIDTNKRTYPHIVISTGVLVAEAGMTYDLPFDPADNRWEPVVTTTPKATKPAPQEDAEPVVTEEAPTTEEQ